ncbi:MAG: GTPase HflX [Betaproteobacteria bacterium]|nr:GTPase HflX [Betaproteobacteria bacterium]
MLDSPAAGNLNPEAAVLVCLDFGEPDFAESMEEIQRLAESAGVSSHVVVRGKRQRPDPALFAGSGKVEEILAAAEEAGAGSVIFNHHLSPVQERNLQKKLDRPVLDRTRLILDIFAQRARTHEGKLQVELAQMQYLSTRLVRGWTHLERQKGGIGLRGGPGETQLEIDRRLIGVKIKSLKVQLEKARLRRGVQRRARSRRDVYSVSLVGYTNAGKSTLFNKLTHAKGYAADQLFATLDTTTRKVYLTELPPSGGHVVISDTVGFILDLPTSLIAAFRATLEETVQADLLLHVVDAASPVRDMQIAEVNKVLAEIGADQVPQLLVLNKIDLPAAAGLHPGVERDECGKICKVRVSAKSGAGLAELRGAVAELAPAHLRSMTRTDAAPPTFHPETA